MAIDLVDVITIAVMGATGSGKSTFVNLLSNSGFEVGVGLLSCTPAVQVSKEFALGGRKIRLIDTPGFDDTLKTDRDILKMIASFLADQYRNNVKLHGIIYMHRISDIRMSGISRRNFSMFRSLCGETTLRNVIIATNMWGEVTEAVGVQRENELRTDDLLFKPVLDLGAQMMRSYDNSSSAQAIIQALVDNHPQALRIQTEIVDESKALEQTTAGAQLESEAVAEAKRKHEEELRQQQAAAEAARRAQEAENARRMEEARREAEAARARAQEEHARLLAQQAAARRREEERLREARRRVAAEEAARREEEERIRQLQEENARIAREAAADRERQRRREEELRRQNSSDDGDCKIF